MLAWPPRKGVPHPANCHASSATEYWALQYCMSKKSCPYLYSESIYKMDKTCLTYSTFLNTNIVTLLINKNINTPMDNCQKDGQTET